MELEYEAAKELFINFASKKLHITYKETGEFIPVETCMNQKREDFITCQSNSAKLRGLSFALAPPNF